MLSYRLEKLYTSLLSILGLLVGMFNHDQGHEYGHWLSIRSAWHPPFILGYTNRVLEKPQRRHLR